ncbi:hypothetical protein N7471_006839 [Penicillium samsonianum]|uniref:uncharacterized protein n=1 Tax=Penicillium samsonianum TaxID=1882272 RepID=UPI002547BEE7|nr:uncharacterized protein N7471_006839 [Penicillium samsonianum]KAJ6140353.1 hypothetical protein N7471_006839 [Penicillium samsonianum]
MSCLFGSGTSHLQTKWNPLRNYEHEKGGSCCDLQGLRFNFPGFRYESKRPRDAVLGILYDRSYIGAEYVAWKDVDIRLRQPAETPLNVNDLECVMSIRYAKGTKLGALDRMEWNLLYVPKLILLVAFRTGQLAEPNVESVLEIYRGRDERWTKEQEYEEYVEISTPPITFASSEETMASTSGPLMPTT